MVGRIKGFFERRRLRKALKARISAARVFLWTNEDVLAPEDAAALRAAVAARDGEAAVALLRRLDPPRAFAGLREWLDILVVSISVAMAFRAYWFEPFNIPTGSMQPTLYGMHSRPARPDDSTMWDVQPLRFFKWAVTGERFVTIKAPCSGIVRLEPRNDGMCRVLVSGNDAGEVPMDAVVNGDARVSAPGADGRPVERMVRVPAALRGVGPDGKERDGEGRLYVTVQTGQSVRAGDTLWCGSVIPGDFLFVNRFAWNFRRPRRGEVMVFGTTGIEGLQQDTHYIKRMTGMPGETVSIDAPRFIADGKPLSEPERIGQISRRESFMEGAPPYAGYVNEGALHSPEVAMELGPDEYFACGDNQCNSYDSRFWGPVPGRKLVGRASFVFWPFTSPRRGFIK